jgi:gamma-glutamyltranspeptidase/glutathione hydrolase
MAAACHYLGATAAFEILEAGGNATDAGVAAGLVLGVVQSEFVSLGGVAPIMLRDAATGAVTTISGLGYWPAAARPEMFRDRHGGAIPEGVLRCVVPAAPDAWITALERFGTMTFGEVARAAIRLARDGFVMTPLMSELIASFAESYARWPSNAAIYLPGGRPPVVGEVFVQADLGASLQYLADEEAAARGDRRAGLARAREAFYRGDIARRIVHYHEENGGLLCMDDLAGFRSEIGRSVRRRFGGLEVHTCGAWCQGPFLLQILGLLERKDMAGLERNSADYLHTLAEAINLAFADRHAYLGDPNFVDVPLDRLLSEAYLDLRAAEIGRRAARRMAGDIQRTDTALRGAGAPAALTLNAARDTSYVCTADRWGNVFSATPSDCSFDSPVIPGLGFCVSSRGSQSWSDPSHPSSVAPGKRPRLTPNPAMAVGDDGSVIPFGTPGGDVQMQAMVQVLLNLTAFGMDAQAAVEAPRVFSRSFVDSFEPHEEDPGRLCVEEGIEPAVAEELQERGHAVTVMPFHSWRAGAVCLIDRRPDGRLFAGADPRRTSYAVGW